MLIILGSLKARGGLPFFARCYGWGASSRYTLWGKKLHHFIFAI